MLHPRLSGFCITSAFQNKQLVFKPHCDHLAVKKINFLICCMVICVHDDKQKLLYLKLLFILQILIMRHFPSQWAKGFILWTKWKYVITISPSYVKHSWKTRSKNMLVRVPVPYRDSSSLLSMPLWSLSRFKYCPREEIQRAKHSLPISAKNCFNRERKFSTFLTFI